MIMKKVNFESWKRSLKEKTINLKEKIDEDFTHAFVWGYLEELFTLEMQIKLLEGFNDMSVEETKTALQEMLFSRLPLRTSSSASYNRADELIVNAISQLINNIVWYAEY